MYYIKMTKSQAKRFINKEAEAGRDVNITLSPCNMHPGYSYTPATTYNVKNVRDFIEVAENFARLNCNPLNGKYPHFYLCTSLFGVAKLG